MRALIVDDSRTVVFALKKILKSAGFITFEALDADMVPRRKAAFPESDNPLSQHQMAQ